MPGDFRRKKNINQKKLFSFGLKQKRLSERLLSFGGKLFYLQSSLNFHIALPG